MNSTGPPPATGQRSIRGSTFVTRRALSPSRPNKCPLRDNSRGCDAFHSDGGDGSPTMTISRVVEGVMDPLDSPLLLLLLLLTLRFS
jgi:hypothetical protein